MQPPIVNVLGLGAMLLAAGLPVLAAEPAEIPPVDALNHHHMSRRTTRRSSAGDQFPATANRPGQLLRTRRPPRPP